MSKQKLHIDNIQIRIPQRAATQSRALAAGLGRALLQAMAQSAPQNNGIKSIAEIDAGKIKTNPADNTERLQQRLAGGVAAALRKKFE
jgi:hypothetical protein